jgi:transcriptional regulator with XRE-family HTH domain
MSKPMSQLRLQRLRWGISRKYLARILGCSDSWLRQLEAGAARGPVAAREWKAKYEAALLRAIEEKRSP